MTFQQPWRDISQVYSSLTMKNREIMYRQLQSPVIKSRIIINSNWQMCDDRERERAHYDINNKPDYVAPTLGQSVKSLIGIRSIGSRLSAVSGAPRRLFDWGNTFPRVTNCPSGWTKLFMLHVEPPGVVRPFAKSSCRRFLRLWGCQWFFLMFKN